MLITEVGVLTLVLWLVSGIYAANRGILFDKKILVRFYGFLVILSIGLVELFDRFQHFYNPWIP